MTEGDDFGERSGAREACGVTAVYSPSGEASRIAYYSLFALQHRGQESAGIAGHVGNSIQLRKHGGLVSQAFSEADIEALQGNSAIGHTRYSTTGSSNIRNAQPFLIDTMHGPVALAHNGNIVNAGALRSKLLKRGVGLTSASDTELMLMTLAGSEGDTWVQRIRTAMTSWVGAFSFVVLTLDGVYAARDPWGFRPLAVGTTAEGSFVVASETCALSTLGCNDIREVAPGEIVACDAQGKISITPMGARSKDARSAACIFEFVYFSRPDSEWNGLSVHDVRRSFGIELAKKSPATADVVIPVPDSSISAAIGFAFESGIPYGEAFVKNRYIGRTFIEPTDSLRKRGVSLKFNVLRKTVEGKRVVVVDDSIVRGNTISPLVALLRQAGAREVHVRVASPPVRHPCMMGVDMGKPEDLVANRIPESGIAAWSGADSLAYLTMESMGLAIGDIGKYCAACFDGIYPVAAEDMADKNRFEF